ncbi:UDP-N-acetylglucosamine transporter, putative [Entamoeba invadens IP1]|uniref:UDP-N-acetylglucosamine transporter, putative n=1 Tax=Entamoeba invadens IP1 TaxID=370355 RepID=A0A0A1TZV1_ENTIV|nr:UDP-N-acetylglucosamine transporter, putative [Entamoeba invadens IP1]ELP87139.1 UDP-N-acetylglucosamine transporter, putative [Entamoeba invadens IP1]|eukprot:XP_004253910.1 UDP-N-acetylglucosamine transporter, putative [Entamoeba invadens IP1]
MNKAVLSAIFLILLTIQATSISIITRYSRGVLKEKYSIPASILLNEILKMVMSFVGIAVTHRDTPLFSHLKLIISCSLVSSVPALIYFFQNMLIQVSLSNIHPGLYSILAQAKILSAALLSVIILGKKLTTTQWRALLALVVCVISVESANRAASANSPSENTGNYFLGVLTALLASTASGFSGVYMEKILKNKVSSGPKLNLWERNFQLSLYSILFAAINVFVVDFKSTFTLGPFHDFSWTAFVMVLDTSIGGILVALVMTYADVIVKGFAVSIAIVCTTICSYFIFDSPITFEFCLGAAGVLIAIANYNDETASYTFQNETKEARKQNEDIRKAEESASTTHTLELSTQQKSKVDIERRGSPVIEGPVSITINPDD